MGVQQLSFSDREYWDECTRDQQSLWVPCLLKRCIAITRNSSYPDEPPALTYDLIPFSADVRETSLQELAHSSGVLVLGDNVLWTTIQLRGPRDIVGDRYDPEAVADVLIIHNVLWTIVGQPLVARNCEVVIGCQAYIRRRRGGIMNPSDVGYDSQVQGT